jgi:hypothetical protein
MILMTYRKLRTENPDRRRWNPALIMIVLILFPVILNAQQEEVRVVKPYSPTLSGAQKIQLLPGMNEEIDFTPPEFEYHLYPKRYDSQFKAQPIRAARMVKMPLKKLYKSQVTLGIGNYFTPLAELNLSQLRSRKGTFGLNIRHHSMNGKVKLDNDLKAEAGFNENSLELYGDRFMKNAVLEYDLGASYNSYVHYGVDPELDTVLDRKDAMEPYFLAEAGLDLHSMNADSFHFDYNAGLDYYYFSHRFEEAEHGAGIDFDFHKKLRVIDIAGELGGAWYGHYPDWDSIVGNHTMFWANPYIGKSAPEWQFTAGVNIYGEVREQFLTLHFYPRASFEFNIVRDVIVPYFGVDGYLESNNYRSIVEENPYVAPTLSVLPTSHKLIGYAGLKGRFSDVFVWNLKGSYSIIDNQYFFVNDTSTMLKNQFNVVYDDITLLKLQGEFSIRPSDAWKVFLKGNYYNYTLVREEHPWNKPAFDLSLQARYNMSDKILINIGVYTIGSRYYENFSSSADATLPLTIDGNLGIEYRYTKLLSFWVRFNNVAAQRYFLYAQYPSYRFRGMIGLTYAL